MTVCTRLEVLPEPRIFEARRKMDELKKGFAVQVAERVVDRARGSEVDKAFAGAAKDICERAEAVELRQAASKKEQAVHNAVEVRRYLAEQVRAACRGARVGGGVGDGNGGAREGRRRSARAALRFLALAVVVSCRAGAGELVRGRKRRSR